jgi:hypothetical protein
MLPKNSQWRYGETGDTVPWYGSMRVFRQQALDDWEPVISSVVKELSAWS